jgi:GNAT superfamily N-acetyltransferase
MKHRPYADVSDIQAMHRVLVAGRKASPCSGYMHRGDLEWRAFGPHGYPLGDLIELWEDGGAVAGWALLSADGFDCQVMPQFRRTQLEGEIIEWAQRRTLQWRRANFQRSLEGDIPAPVVPDGWDVRGLRDEDIDSRATAQYEAFAPGSKTTPETWRHLMAHAPGYDRELDNVVVDPDGTVATGALTWVDPDNCVGLFEPVGTRPAFQRRGCGRAALLRGLRVLRDRGMSSAIVSTNATNGGAMALYRSVGFEERNQLCTYTFTE